MILVSDSFTDTDGVNINSHTPEIGSQWAIHVPSTLAASIIISNRLTKDSQSGQSVNYNPTTVDGDAYVQAPLRVLSALSVNAGLLISVDPNSDDYVMARHNKDNNECSIRSVVPGSSTIIGTATLAMSLGDVLTLRLERIGNLYRMLLGGTEVIAPVQILGHTGRKIGTRFAGAASGTTGYAFDSLEAGTLSASLGTIARPQFLSW